MRASGPAWAAEPVGSKEGIRLSLTTRLGEQGQAPQADAPPTAAAEGQQQEGLLIRMATRLSGQFAGSLAAPEWALREELKPEQALPTEKPRTKYRLIWPLRWHGVVSYTYRSENLDNQQLDSQYLTLQLNAASFIWRPWFAQVSGGLGISKDTASGGGQQGTVRSNSDMWSANAQLSALPLSRFPLTAHFDRTDSTTEYLLVGSQYVSTRYGFTQRYRPLRSKTKYMFNYEGAQQERLNGITDTFNGVAMEVNHQMEEHRFDFHGNLTQNSSSDGLLDSTYQNWRGRHYHTRGSWFSIDNLLSFSEYQNTTTSVLRGAQQTQNRMVQLNSLASWRPEDKINVTGGVRISDLNYSTSAATNNQNLTAYAYVGGTYSLNRHTTVNGIVSLSQSQSLNRTIQQSTQTLGASYRPDPIPLGEVRYQWFTSGSASNRIGSASGVQGLAVNGQHYTVQLGHSLDRRYQFSPTSMLMLNGFQHLNQNYDTQTYDVVNAYHGASASWQLGRGEMSSYFRVSASDGRNVSGPEMVYQMVNFQASLNRLWGSRSSLMGHLTIQATKQVTANTPDQGYSLSNSGDITYMNRRLLGVPRLRFLSQFKVSQNNYAADQDPNALSPALRDTETLSWENRMDYSVGLTGLSLIHQIAEINGTMRDLVQFRILRQFGDL